MILKRFINDVKERNKLNSLTKYPSILTLHKLGDRGTLLNELTDPSITKNDTFYATEKIDGTNVRIIIHRDEFILGSRENLLHYSKDTLYDPAQGIVDAIKSLKSVIPYTNGLMVIYGELYGGNVTSHSNWYGKSAVGFRVFDICDYDFGNVDWITMLLQMEQSQISHWREHEENGILKYGQPFMNLNDEYKSKFQFEFVPSVKSIVIDPTVSHLDIMTQMKMNLPETKCKLTENALGACEGIVIRASDRSKIYKLRFEDYQKTLNKSVNKNLT